MSGWLTIAAAVALTSLPAVPYVAAHWGQRTEIAARSSAAIVAPPAAPTQPSPPVAVKPIPLPPPAVVAAAPSPAATAPAPAPPDSIEIVRTRPMADPTLPAELSPSAEESARVEAATAQQRGTFKSKKTVEKTQPPAAATPPAATPTPAAPEPAATSPEPDRWSEADVATALKTCIQALGPIAANVETLAPIRQDKCGTPAPVSLKRVGQNAQSVEFSPPAVLNCAMVAKINDWVEKVLQPTARDVFGASVIRMNSTSGYVCRGRNGDMMPSGKISEHALANALDVASFTLSDGRIVDVGKHWGPTRRDPRPSQAGPVHEPAPPEPPQPPPASKTKRGAAQPVAPEPVKAPAPPPPEANTKEAQFLRRLHQGACGMFGTVLGPEANEAHREHFHFDLHPRRHSSYCQ